MVKNPPSRVGLEKKKHPKILNWSFLGGDLVFIFFVVCQERKIGPKRTFSGRISRGRPGVIRADILAQNFGKSPQNPGKTSIRRGHPSPEGADVHDPKGSSQISVRKTLG